MLNTGRECSTGFGSSCESGDRSVQVALLSRLTLDYHLFVRNCLQDIEDGFGKNLPLNSIWLYLNQVLNQSIIINMVDISRHLDALICIIELEYVQFHLFELGSVENHLVKLNSRGIVSLVVLGEDSHYLKTILKLST